jgi:hypothetical protein
MGVGWPTALPSAFHTRYGTPAVSRKKVASIIPMPASSTRGRPRSVKGPSALAEVAAPMASFPLVWRAV